MTITKDSILGLQVTGHLNREGSDFEGVVTEEYRVASGPLKGVPMVAVLATDGKTKWAFRAHVEVKIAFSPETIMDMIVYVENWIADVPSDMAEFLTDEELVYFVMRDYPGGLERFLIESR